ncbi:nucleotidyltransferase substrate binding protein [Tepidibacter mesophilus]|uniref:nucleotidyltransferase substrate binding protein n=1 Tax=Tepidibacter mesophilus TaxID=655607 RepID=UPI0016514E46|nr:nucleotidyltransferase substrate binding protein [Tepidibacter mesophilus]
MDRILQKYENTSRALKKLCELDNKETLDSDIFRDALIQRFEFTFELTWKFLKVYLEDQGINDINSPKSVLKAAYAERLINEEMVWINMLRSRNLTSHIYSEKTAIEISESILKDYIPQLKKLVETMEGVV